MSSNSAGKRSRGKRALFILTISTLILAAMPLLSIVAAAFSFAFSIPTLTKASIVGGYDVEWESGLYVLREGCTVDVDSPFSSHFYANGTLRTLARIFPPRYTGRD